MMQIEAYDYMSGATRAILQFPIQSKFIVHNHWFYILLIIVNFNAVSSFILILKIKKKNRSGDAIHIDIKILSLPLDSL